jgi:hypothetical protein
LSSWRALRQFNTEKNRVSTDKQTVENQVIALRQIAERRGWEVVDQYSDAGISGAKGRDGRPGLDQMLKDASRRKFDVIMAWAIDRLGRSLIDLLSTILTLEACGVDLYLDQQSIDTTTPAGKLMFQVTGAFAEFERSMTRARWPEARGASLFYRAGWHHNLRNRSPTAAVHREWDQNFIAAPSLKAPMYGFVVRIALRQHVPLRTGVENPQHRFKDTTRGNRLSTRTPIRNVFFRKMIPDAFPLPVREPNHSTFIADRQQSVILR